MDIILVVYALCVFLLGPIWIIRSVKANSQNKMKMVATIKCNLCVKYRVQIEEN